MNVESKFDYMSILKVSEDKDAIYVEGETFVYGFSKKTGLLNSINVMGNDFLKMKSSGILDIYVSDNEIPQKAMYSAKYETEAECAILSYNPHEVHIRTHGFYRNHNGIAFPIRYRITYEIASDGTIFIIIDNKATDSCIPRWLCISSGTIYPSLCKYYSYLAEQNSLYTTGNYSFGIIGNNNKKLFESKFIPWFWFGNDTVGIDIAIWDIGHQRYGTTIITDQMNDQYPNIDINVSATSSENMLSWDILSIKNNITKVNSGWEYTSYYSLSINPSKKPNLENLNMVTLYISPEKHHYPSNEQIQLSALKGINTFIVSINQTGIYDIDNENEMKRVISICHDNGIKVIPNISLMKLNKNLEIFDSNANEWQIEPSSNSSESTSLMCPGSEGWREYWKEKIDQIIDKYDFDGLFIEIDYNRLACKNQLHGCQRKHIRPTFLWVREMMIHAWLKMKSKSLNSIIIAKTDMMPISMICNWTDIRCVESKDEVYQFDPLLQKAYYYSYNKGCNSMSLIESDIDKKLILLSLLYMSMPVISYDQLESDKFGEISKYWQIYNFFGINKADWHPSFNEELSMAKSSFSSLFVNIHKQDNILLTAINLSDEEINCDITLTRPEELGLNSNGKYLVYDPLSKSIHNGLNNATMKEISEIPISVSPQSVRFLYICEYPLNPSLLFMIGFGELIKQLWDDSKKVLKVMLSAQEGLQAEIAIYFPYGKPNQISVNERNLPFEW
ncbi:TPA: hypothetical protein ENS27_06400, partial [bacterium]|nr:hypothetical protein [bacterium]